MMWFCVLYFFVLVQSDPRSSAMISSLQSHYYNQNTGLWQNGWWNSGNSLEAVIEYIQYSNDNKFLNVIDNAYTHTTTGQSETGSFDDDEWWGITWYRAYQLTKQTRYLQRSIDIWNFILSHAWDTTKCGGGIWWSSDKTYKNAITNELFFVHSTLLALEQPSNSTYSHYAALEWTWFENSGMINAQYLINDGLDSNCRNNHQNEWTYNQGVILGGLFYLHQMTGNATLLSIAENIASAVMSSLVYSDGVLKENCEPNNCDVDQLQFKGIYMRYLAILIKGLNDANKTKFTNWIQLNANAIWNNARNPSDSTVGAVWNGPANQKATATTQTSALDCFNAVMLIS